MDFKNILYEVKEGILYLTLNRPEMRNALTPGNVEGYQHRGKARTG